MLQGNSKRQDINQAVDFQGIINQQVSYYKSKSVKLGNLGEVKSLDSKVVNGMMNQPNNQKAAINKG